MKLWISFKSFSATFSDTVLLKEREHIASLLPGGGRSPGFPPPPLSPPSLFIHWGKRSTSLLMVEGGVYVPLTPSWLRERGMLCYCCPDGLQRLGWVGSSLPPGRVPLILHSVFSIPPKVLSATFHLDLVRSPGSPLGLC